MKYGNILEEELKNKIGIDYFPEFDSSKIIGKVDFCITLKNIPLVKGSSESLGVVGENSFLIQSLIWAEAKKGKSDLINSFVQLILTIGRARTFDKELPPSFLGAFDAYKFAFLPYNSIQDIFYVNDFDWTVTPSNYATKEFKLLHSKVKAILEKDTLIFDYEIDDKELREFIRTNFIVGKSDTSKIQIDKNNFLSIYTKWLVAVKPSILINWEMAQKLDIVDADFYLADILSDKNQSLKESLFVLLKGDHYELDKKLDDIGFFSSKRTNFVDSQKAHIQFWNRYQRPPKADYWDYILERRDLLVAQDIRERKGSFFTPLVWVEKSQEYLAKVLGENWQDDYYIWDCCAGTGNLLNGLTNKYNIFASTLDRQDVDVMQDRIKNGANLDPKYVFQFDFLNDSFDDPKVPALLREILQNPKERKKLVMFINPPYAEATSGATVTGTGKHKTGVAIDNKTYLKYRDVIGKASNELFAQIFIRIAKELTGCYLGGFSTLKYTNSTNFIKFREHFLAEYKAGFIIPADTFDNVNGKFPIGFLAWNTGSENKNNTILVDVFDRKNKQLEAKSFYSQPSQSINKWIKKFDIKKTEQIGFMSNPAPDFQQNNLLYLCNKKGTGNFNFWAFKSENLIFGAVYFAVRHSIKHTWIKHNDQFLQPNNNWKADLEFQNNCFAFMLFHNKNRISSIDTTNHWIPFREKEVNACGRFRSHFMSDYIAGKLVEKEETIFGVENIEQEFPLEFSQEAKAVFDAGRELWKYYHSFEGIPTQFVESFKAGKILDPHKIKNPNASFYDIKQYFQGTNSVGRMNSGSKDEKYNQLLKNLNQEMDILATAIEPKVYKYGFLLK